MKTSLRTLVLIGMVVYTSGRVVVELVKAPAKQISQKIGVETEAPQEENPKEQATTSPEKQSSPEKEPASTLVPASNPAVPTHT